MSVNDTSIGAVFAEKFRIERTLGEGGMGAVFEATNVLTGGRVAIKVVREDRADASLAQRMLTEARTLAKMAHPNIVRLFDADTHRGELYLVQELVDGRSLRDLLSDALVLDARVVIEVLLPLLDALEYAHARGVVHRDIKPDNILLAGGAKREPKLIDFGIALASSEDRHTRSGTILGTPRYMSPEQAWGRDDVDARSDLWSLAAVAYECLSGSTPYDGNNDRAVLAEIVANDPRPLAEVAHSVDEQLADVIMRGLVRARDERVQSASALREALLSLDGAIGNEPWYVALRARYGMLAPPLDSAERRELDGDAISASAAPQVIAVTTVAPAQQRAAGVWPKALGAVALASVVSAVAMRAPREEQTAVIAQRASRATAISEVTASPRIQAVSESPAPSQVSADAGPALVRPAPRVAARVTTGRARADAPDASARSRAALVVGTNRAPIVEDE